MTEDGTNYYRMFSDAYANATSLTTGTVPTARISGSYTSITGVGTLTAGVWNGTVISAAYGGTGQLGGYAVGDILYANGASALTKLAAVATGNVLISGGVTTAPAWGKVGLTTHVTGTLAMGNGGTGATSFTANGVIFGNGSGILQVTAAGTEGKVLQASAGGAPVFGDVDGGTF